MREFEVTRDENQGEREAFVLPDPGTREAREAGNFVLSLFNDAKPRGERLKGKGVCIGEIDHGTIDPFGLQCQPNEGVMFLVGTTAERFGD